MKYIQTGIIVILVILVIFLSKLTVWNINQFDNKLLDNMVNILSYSIEGNNYKDKMEIKDFDNIKINENVLKYKKININDNNHKFYSNYKKVDGTKILNGNYYLVPIYASSSYVSNDNFYLITEEFFIERMKPIPKNELNIIDTHKLARDNFYLIETEYKESFYYYLKNFKNKREVKEERERLQEGDTKYMLLNMIICTIFC